MTEDLTARQLAILEFIARHIAEKRFPPTIREIGEGMGIRSTNGVNDHLKALERKGFLTRGELKSRALVPTEQAWDALGERPPQSAHAANDDMAEFPLLGNVAAGAPLLAIEDRETVVRVDPALLGSIGSRSGVFALRIVGESMIGDGILDGDIVFVRRQATASPGEIVVAMIEGEATVKRYFPEGDQVRFQPSNPAMEPIYVRRADARSAEIIGLVVGLFRKV